MREIQFTIIYKALYISGKWSSLIYTVSNILSQSPEKLVNGLESLEIGNFGLLALTDISKIR